MTPLAQRLLIGIGIAALLLLALVRCAEVRQADAIERADRVQRCIDAGEAAAEAARRRRIMGDR